MFLWSLVSIKFAKLRHLIAILQSFSPLPQPLGCLSGGTGKTMAFGGPGLRGADLEGHLVWLTGIYSCNSQACVCAEFSVTSHWSQERLQVCSCGPLRHSPTIVTADATPGGRIMTGKGVWKNWHNSKTCTFVRKELESHPVKIKGALFRNILTI